MAELHRNGGGKAVKVVGTIQDISPRKKTEAELERLSFHDHLTGLYNRRYFERALRLYDSSSYLPISIIVGDINGLKLLNDALGHTAGDRIIQKTAEVLQSCCRSGDILARTGGDEFSLLMPDTDYETGMDMLKRFHSACQKYNASAPSESHCLNIALGCATKENEPESISATIKRAESSMYRRKLLDRSSVHSTLITSIRTTLFEKSHETQEHADRLTRLTHLVGKAFDLNEAQLNELELLSTLHDVGKISFSDKILLKPGGLTDEEFMEIKKHPETGYRIAMASPELKMIADYILCHHERWDGNGYPQGLSGENIPFLSRILSVCDTYDAMTIDRVYRKAVPAETALTEIQNNSGTQFDPEIVQVFVKEVFPVYSALS